MSAAKCSERASTSRPACALPGAASSAHACQACCAYLGAGLLSWPAPLSPPSPPPL
eukprot:CAMPEP_0179898524 /NCGR_PEP_ID=MMETSP0982-20121206/37722_1 /TAXON_ID=483367 /ORGANISM="non described non described, Strain CCMP 2436" /LENGTH=55 /DNA_ID=CAMNT_0021795901 /DNA_START=306 /DNA_END=469 /DNA_ORIENTATION=-